MSERAFFSLCSSTLVGGLHFYSFFTTCFASLLMLLGSLNWCYSLTPGMGVRVSLHGCIGVCLGSSRKLLKYSPATKKKKTVNNRTPVSVARKCFFPPFFIPLLLPFQSHVFFFVLFSRCCECPARRQTNMFLVSQVIFA
jgi:hypothetical protein